MTSPNYIGEFFQESIKIKRLRYSLKIRPYFGFTKRFKSSTDKMFFSVKNCAISIYDWYSLETFDK